MVENLPANAGDAALVPSLETEIPTCHWATKSVAPQLSSPHSRASVP